MINPGSDATASVRGELSNAERLQQNEINKKFILLVSFVVMTKHWGASYTMFCYAGLCAAAFVYTLLKVKETKGETPEEMETLFIA